MVEDIPVVAEKKVTLKKEKMFESIIGHQRTLKEIETAVLGSGGSFLFFGPPSIGKRTVAMSAARHVLCVGDRSMGCSCLSCRRINGGHPDLFVVGSKGRIKVEDVEVFLNFLQSVPFISSHKVSVFDNADDMTWEASNKLLKAFEEYQDHYFFLVSSNAEKIIPTIRSRCLHFKFNSLRPEDIVNILWIKKGFELPKAKSLGWVGSEGVDVFSNPSLYIELRESVLTLFSTVVKKDICQALDLVDRYSSEPKALLDLFLILITDMLMIKDGCENSVVNKDQVGEIKKACEKVDYRFLILLGNLFGSAKENQHLNIDLGSRLKNNIMKAGQAL